MTILEQFSNKENCGLERLQFLRAALHFAHDPMELRTESKIYRLIEQKILNLANIKFNYICMNY